MKNLKDMEKNENYFVREDIVSEQHVHHKDEYREKKRDKVIFTSTILEETTPQPKRKEDYEKSEYFLGLFNIKKMVLLGELRRRS